MEKVTLTVMLSIGKACRRMAGKLFVESRSEKMREKIRLDLVSDVVCPWCIVGFNHLNAAIEKLGLRDNVDLHWQPFELNPDMPPEGEDLQEHLARKYGTSKADSERFRSNITQAGAKYGFTFNYSDTRKIVNTFDAHVLLNYAQSVGKQTALKLRLFHAYFTESKDVSNRDILVQEADSVGIPPSDARAALDNRLLIEQVHKAESEWKSMGITGVPTVVFNRKSALSGAQPQAVFEQVLSQLMEGQ